jgi:spore coat protein U-like protein
VPKKPLILLAVFLLLAIVPGGRARATTCSVGGGGLNFGAYDRNAASGVTATGTVYLQCSSSFLAVLSLNVGNGKGATFSGGRRMTVVGGAGTMIYNLYADSGYNRVFGDGTGGSVTVQISGAKRYTQSVWGVIPAGQSALAPGNYADDIYLTVSY